MVTTVEADGLTLGVEHFGDAAARTIDMDPALAGELRSWKARQPDARINGDRFVFARSTGAKPGEDNIRSRVIKRVVDLANETLDDEERLGNVTPHGLRVTYASMMYEVGENPAYVAEQMGHEDPATTMSIYLRVMRRRDRQPDEWAALLGRDPGSVTKAPAVSITSP